MIDESMKTFWYPKDGVLNNRLISNFAVIRAFTSEDRPIYGIRLAISQYKMNDINHCAYEGLKVELCDWEGSPIITNVYKTAKSTRDGLKNCYQCNPYCGAQRQGKSDSFPYQGGRNGGPASGQGKIEHHYLFPKMNNII